MKRDTDRAKFCAKCINENENDCMYCVDGSRGMRNLIHCTDPEDGADAWQREINLWFTEKEIMDYRLVSEAMLYDVNLDGMKE